MARYEILDESGEVINTIVACEQFMKDNYEPNEYRLVTPPEPEIPTWNTAPPEYFQIHVGSFYDRFGAAKIPVLASEDRVVQALIADTQPRVFIDLKRPDLPQMLSVLMSKVPEVTQEIADAVLELKTTDEERVIKGLVQPDD